MSKSSATTKRAVGRPTADGPDLREQLLDASLRCFVREGIAATSLRSIAREAGTTSAMLHYYFGDKTQLLAAITGERFMPSMMELRAPLNDAGNDLRALISTFVKTLMEIISKNPWLPPLWVREVLAEGGALRDLVVNEIAPQLPQVLVAHFTQAKREGKIPVDVDASLLVTSLLGLTLFPAAAAPVWQRMFPGHNISTADIERHAIALLTHGLGIGEAT